MLLTVSGLTKLFPATRALDGVDFSLAAGEVHALLGENGAGKSTLIKCLTGAYARDGGTITLDGTPIAPHSTGEAQALGIGTVYQEVNLAPNMTVAQNLLFGREPRRWGMIDTRAMRTQTREVLGRYGLTLDPDRDLGSYSVAIRQIVAIARAVELSGKVLILDEPTASLDAAEVAMLFDVVRGLRERGLGIIFVSHFLDQVFAISDRITVLRNGRHVITEEAGRLSRMELIRHMLSRALEGEVTAPAATPPAEAAPLLRFAGFGRPGAVEPFDLAISRGEIVGLAGLLGSGRTETAEAIFGIRPATTGEARNELGPLDLSTPRRAIAAGFGLVPEERKTDGIAAELSVRENIILSLQARRGWSRPLARAEQDRIADDYIRRLDIRTSGREKPIGELSGGNQQKAVLARWLAMNPQFLILDEPTRGIDVGAHAEILRLIRELTEGGMSILLISSEIDELVASAGRVIVLRDRRHVAELTAPRVTAADIMRAIAGAGADGPAPQAPDAATGAVAEAAVQGSDLGESGRGPADEGAAA